MQKMGRGWETVTDSHRDAEQYHRLLLALERAILEVREIEREDQPSLEGVIGRLLPDLAEALNAEKAFLSILRGDPTIEPPWLELLSIYPDQHLRRKTLTDMAFFEPLLQEGRPKVVAPPGAELLNVIPALDILDATSTILVRLQTADSVYIVGVCNKTRPDLGPFLGSDVKALNMIVELVAIGARIGEQRRRELMGIQKTAAAISAELVSDELLPVIVKGAADVFQAPAVSLMLLEQDQNYLTIREAYGLSDAYKQHQRLPAQNIIPPAISPTSQKEGAQFKAYTKLNLQKTPDGDPALIAAEDLYSVLGAPLVMGDDNLVGLLNIYSKGAPRQFTPHEQELAQTFAFQAAIALQNAAQYERLLRQREQLLALNESSKTIIKSLDRMQTLREILSVAVRLTGARVATIQEVKGQHLHIAEVYPPEEREHIISLIGSSLPLTGQGITVKVVNSKKPILANDVTGEPLYLNGTDQETLAELAVPLIEDGEVRGVLNVEHHQKYAFDDGDIKVLTGLADLAVIAIQHTSHFDRLKKKREQLQALYEAGKFIAKVGLETEAVLQTILNQAVKVTNTTFGSMHLMRGDQLEFVAAYPPERLSELQEKIGKLSLDGRGITVRAIRCNDAQLVPDVSQDPDFIDATGETRSEIAVVLRQNGEEDGEPIGVLNVEHREVQALDINDRELLITLANLAVVAINNTRQYIELNEAKDRNLAAEAVAWLGLFGADWQHTINQKTFSIRNYVDALRSWTIKQRIPPTTANTINLTLNGIEEVTDSIVQFTDQVPSDTAGNSDEETLIDSELRETVTNWCAGHLNIISIFDLQCPGIKASIPANRLRLALEKIISNALKAMPNGGRLIVTTRLVDHTIYITIEDTGHGIPEAERERFLRRPIDHKHPRSKGDTGSGKGVIIALFVARTSGGNLELVETETNVGTKLLMTLPAV